MAAVGGGVDDDIVGRTGDGTFQDRLERTVSRVVGVECKIIGEHDEAFFALGERLDDVGQVHEVGGIDLDQSQPVVDVLTQQCLDDRGLAGTAGAPQ